MIHQKRRSLQPRPKERGVSADRWTGYYTETEWRRGYDMMLRFSGWVMPEQRSGAFLFFFFKLTSRSNDLPSFSARQTESVSSPPSIGFPTHTSGLAHLHHKSDFNKSILSHTYTTLPVFGHFFIASTNRNAPRGESKLACNLQRNGGCRRASRRVIKVKSGPRSLQGEPSAPQFTQEKHNPWALKQLSDRASVLHINLSCSQVEVNAKYRHTHCTAGSFALFGNYSDVFSFVWFRDHSSHRILWTPTRTKLDFST